MTTKASGSSAEKIKATNTVNRNEPLKGFRNVEPNTDKKWHHALLQKKQLAVDLM
jgi:hypothetical protein